MPPAGFNPAISASEQSQTHALDRAATGSGMKEICIQDLVKNLTTKSYRQHRAPPFGGAPKMLAGFGFCVKHILYVCSISTVNSGLCISWSPKFTSSLHSETSLTVPAVCELVSSASGYALVRRFPEIIIFHTRWNIS